MNYLHPRPEEISITKPKDRFKKINDTQFEWEFQNLKPTLADDMKIVVHPAYDTYPAERSNGEDRKFRAEYVIEDQSLFSSAQRLRRGRELDAETGPGPQPRYSAPHLPITARSHRRKPQELRRQ